MESPRPISDPTSNPIRPDPARPDPTRPVHRTLPPSPTASPLDELEAPPRPAWQRDAIAWVEANPSLAMLGAFASGVFIGVLMRR